MKYSPVFKLCTSLIAIFICTPSFGSDQFEKIEAFARTFGYVRYFHPSDQAAMVDWEAMAYYGTNETLNSPNDETSAQLIKRLFDPIVESLEVYAGPQKPLPESKEVDANQIVAWQHNGVGMEQRGLYRSVRLNRTKKVPSNAAGPFGNVLQSVDAKELQGEEIRLRFDAKIEKGKCRLQGWWRIDRESGDMGLFENMGNRPIKEEDWKEYELVGTVDKDASNLVLGFMFFGKGSALLDNVRLEKNEGDQWSKIELKNADFEQGSSTPENWLQPVQGYSVETETKDASNGKQSVRIQRGSSNEHGNKIFDLIPKMGEVVDVKIAPDLRIRMPLAIKVKTVYKKGDNDAIDQFLGKVNNTETDNADQETSSVANVVLLWNVFQHFYPYFEQVETDWDAALKTSLKNGIAAADDRESATRNLKWLVAQLHDGHGNVFDTKSRPMVAPVQFDWVENKVIVVASEDANIKVGDIVTHFGKDPVDEKIKELEELISGSPQWKRYRSVGQLSQGTDPINITIQRGDETLEAELKFAARQRPTRDKGDVCRIEVDSDEDSDDIWYIDMGRAEPKDINDKIAKLSEAKGIVLDFRGYPRGTQFLFQFMTDEHMQSQKWQVPQQIHPDRVDMKEIETMGRWEMPPRKPRFKGKMVFITNGSAISYAESCMAIVANYKLGEIIGSPTAGANGNVNPFGLPGGYRIAWTGMRVMNHDDSQHHVNGVQPTIPMKPTIKGIRAGKDELLDHAIELIEAE